MAAITTTRRSESLPVEVMKEYIAETRDGKVHFKRIKWPTEFQNLSKTTEVIQSVNEGSNSGSVLFSVALKTGFVAGTLTAGSPFYFTNLGHVSSTSTVSALYEHVRGYVYRNFGTSAADQWNNYLATTAGSCGLIISKTLSGVAHAAAYKAGATGRGSASALAPVAAVTAIRIIAMNRGYFKDRVKAGSWRMQVQPTSVDVLSQRGLNFDNDDKTDSMSGDWASVTGMDGLTGSLLNRGVQNNMFSNAITVNQKNITGFTVGMRVKFINDGSTHQTLLHRRLGNTSLSALGADFASGSGRNNAVVTTRYSSFSAMNAAITPTIQYVEPTFGGEDGFYDSSKNSNSATYWTVQNLTGGTSAVFIITNDGGGQLYYGLTSNRNYPIDFHAAGGEEGFGAMLRFAPWLTPISNPGFVASAGTNNGLAGWVKSDGTQYDSTSGTNGFAHAASGAYGNYFNALSNTNYMAITNDDTTESYVYMRLSSPAAKTTFQVNTPAYAIANGSDRIVLRFDATVSGGEFTNAQSILTEVLATPEGAAPNSASAVTISSYSTRMSNPSTVSGISLTCNFLNGIDRKLDHKGIDLWFKIGNNHTTSKFYAIDNFQCEYVPSTLYGLGNRLSTSASVTAYLDSTVSAILPYLQSLEYAPVWQFQIGNNHPWIKCPNYPQTFNLQWNTQLR